MFPYRPWGSRGFLNILKYLLNMIWENLYSICQIPLGCRIGTFQSVRRAAKTQNVLKLHIIFFFIEQSIIRLARQFRSEGFVTYNWTSQVREKQTNTYWKREIIKTCFITEHIGDGKAKGLFAFNQRMNDNILLQSDNLSSGNIHLYFQIFWLCFILIAEDIFIAPGSSHKAAQHGLVCAASSQSLQFDHACFVWSFKKYVSDKQSRTGPGIYRLPLLAYSSLEQDSCSTSLCGKFYQRLWWTFSE